MSSVFPIAFSKATFALMQSYFSAPGARTVLVINTSLLFESGFALVGGELSLIWCQSSYLLHLCLSDRSRLHCVSFHVYCPVEAVEDQRRHLLQVCHDFSSLIGSASDDHGSGVVISRDELCSVPVCPIVLTTSTLVPERPEEGSDPKTCSRRDF